MQKHQLGDHCADQSDAFRGEERPVWGAMLMPESPTGLYWSRRGQVACPHHASLVEEDRCTADGWVVLPLSSQGFHGRRYQCQYCSPDGTPIVHSNASYSRSSPQTSSEHS